MFGFNNNNNNNNNNRQHKKQNSGNYYFVKDAEVSTPTKNGGSGKFSEIESVPPGTTEEEFAPRPITTPYIAGRKTAPSKPVVTNEGTRVGGQPNFLQRLFGGGSHQKPSSGGANYGDTGTLVKLRKAPIKIEPKVFFANERTFLAWMHLSVILAGASIAILAFAETDDGALGQLYGVIMLPVAIAFIVYSMYQYHRRATMIRHRHPGPYEDTTGPTVLASMLMISILAQFGLKLYALAYTS